jgi:hypothetical protein
MSGDLASMHRVQHLGVNMDPRFYENDFMITNDEEELKVMRSPFYEFAMEEQLGPDAVGDLL